MGLEVIYGGCKDDKFSRELVVTARGDKLVVRKIFRKFTMSDAYKEKYPEAKEVDYTRNRYELLEWVESFDYQRANPKTAPMVTLIFEGQRYFYNKISGQWWDLPMLKYWNMRLSDLLQYDDDRTFRMNLEEDRSRNCLLLTLNQRVVDEDLTPCIIRVFRNNEEIYKEHFSFLTFNMQRQIEDGTDCFSQVRSVLRLDAVEPHDIYCIHLESQTDLYQFHNWHNGKSLTKSIPKFLMFGLEQYEQKLGEEYRFKNEIFG